MKALVIAGVNLRRLFRERSNIFFVFLFPMLLILMLGAAFGGSNDVHIGVVATNVGPLGDELVAAIGAGDQIVVDRYDDEAALVHAVEQGRVSAGVVIPAGYDAALRAGGNQTLLYVAQATNGPLLRSTIEAAAATQSATLRAARFVQGLSPAGTSTFASALQVARLVASSLPPITVQVQTTGEATFPPTLGKFDLGASSQLLLFVFLTSLTGSAALIETRALGISRRMLATPTPVAQIVVGETLGRFGVALVQGVFIMLASLIVFGVHWGNAAGAIAILVMFAMVGSGAGMLLGATAGNAQQAGPIGMLAGLGFAALGGCMVPIELFTPLMRRVAHVTPHAWALDAFAELVRHGAGIGDILPQLGVLLAWAVVLLALATWRLRVSLTQ